MNRRHFFAATGAAAALATSSTASARAAKGPRVIVPALKPEELADLAAVAPGADLIQCKGHEEAVAQAAGADASYGFISAEILRAGKSLKWVQQPSAGVEHLIETLDISIYPLVLQTNFMDDVDFAG